MYSDDLIIEKFSLSDEALFQERLKKINISPDCDFLSKQTFPNSKYYSKRIFILLKNEKQGLLRKKQYKK